MPFFVKSEPVVILSDGKPMVVLYIVAEEFVTIPVGIIGNSGRVQKGFEFPRWIENALRITKNGFDLFRVPFWKLNYPVCAVPIIFEGFFFWHTYGAGNAR